MLDKPSALRAMLPKVDGDPAAMVALARQLMGSEDRAMAIDLAARALALPHDGEVDVLARDVLSDGVPRWHFGIVRDQRRNQAYEDALRRAITPGCRVLEIGAGTGLLSMMAARAGAEVVTCEMDPAVAAVAREVVAANGLADRVRVLNKHSGTVALDDLGGPADVLVSEIVSSDLLSEGVLPAHEDAVRRLLRPGAAVIPCRGRVRVALAELIGWGDRPPHEASGFDLSALNNVARPHRFVPVNSDRIRLRSAPVDLLDFDFASPGPWRTGRHATALAATGGTVQGVLQWIALDMDAYGHYENAPDIAVPSCWDAIFWPFQKMLETDAGQEIGIGVRFDPDRMWIWAV